MKIEITDWTGNLGNPKNGKWPVIATIELDQFKGFSYDGGRLDFDGYPYTIYVSNQFSVNIVD